MTAPDEKPNTMEVAAASGDELALLYAIRNKLAAAIEDCPVRDLSPLTRRLQDTVKEIRDAEERKKKADKDASKRGDGSSGKWDPADEL